jgi:hypothetical protein
MMVGSDDDTIEVGTNEELWMCGMGEDDDEDDMHDDREALFGRSIEAPVNVGDDHEVKAPSVEDENSAKLSHPSTSLVWQDYDKIFETVDGKYVRYPAK